MDSVLLNQFKEVILAHTGLFLRQEDYPKLDKAVQDRMRVLRITGEREYLSRLTSNTPASHLEWNKLVAGLTTAETFFFRDKGQFKLLRDHLLPEIVDHRRQERKLRIWSAGCSTGEEPYSVAILLSELLPDWQEWDIFILGTDINKSSIDRARQGHYGAWSFRMVAPEVQETYFHRGRRGWQIVDSIRRMVTFRTGNLRQDIFPEYQTGIHDMDVILCRNVFIYFHREAIQAVVQKFAQTLRPGGYLITGHSELYDQPLDHLKARFFPESVIYQRDDSAHHSDPFSTLKTFPSVTKPTVPEPLVERNQMDVSTPPTRKLPPVVVPIVKPPEAKTVLASPLEDAKAAFRLGRYTEVIDMLGKQLQTQRDILEAYELLAESYANLARYTEAAECCWEALRIDPYAPKPYYLLAHLAEEQGNLKDAREYYKKIIYAAPEFVPAYLDLAHLYDRDGDSKRAQKMRSIALGLLTQLEADQLVEPYHVTVADLCNELKNITSCR